MFSWSLTILCACAFLVVKYFEYAHKFEEGWLPGKFYHATGDAIPGSHGYATFFAFYFMMTGLHGIHILAGIGLLSWILMRTRSGRVLAHATVHPGGLGGIVLAHRRLNLDLLVPAVLPDPMSTHTETTHNHDGDHAGGHEHGGPAIYARTLFGAGGPDGGHSGGRVT